MAKAKAPIQVRAKVAHTEPGTQTYRSDGEVFEHRGELYKHVELAGKQEAADELEFGESEIDPTE